jgi:glycine dehydrogenase subunit 1
VFSGFHFKEFTVQFGDKTVEEVNQSLLDNRLHGGKSLVGEFPDLGETALFCVTESHTKEDIDRLAYALEEALEG